MKVTVDPLETRTSVPVVITVQKAEIAPRASVSPIGEIPLRKNKQEYTGSFYVQTPGQYLVVVSSGDQVVKRQVTIEKQKFLNFGVEFGIFLILFVLATLGVILWTKRIMRNRPS